MRKFKLFFSHGGVILLIAVILTVVFFSFYPTLHNDFVLWDDDFFLSKNIPIQTLDLEHVKELFKSTVLKIYVPLTMLSFAIEHHFFGYDPFIYHLDNLLLHMGVVALIFWLGMRLGLTAVGSAVAALLFGIHPMHVESVAWATERKDVLYSFFYLAALLSYSRYLAFTESTQSLQIKKQYRFLVLTTFFGFLSMLAKPMALSLPLILLLFDWFHRRKIGKEIIIEKIPLGLLIAGIALISYVAHARVPGRNIIEGILIWIWTFVFYLKQFVFPVVLVPIYQLPKPIMISNPEYFLSVGFFCFLALALIRLRKNAWFVFSFLFYFFSIFFLLRFDDTGDPNIVADRFMYLPSLGFCFLAGWGWMQLSEHKKARIIGAIVLLAIMSVLSIKTYQQCQIWRDSVSLLEHELTYFPDESIALNNLGATLREKEEYKKAETLYGKYIDFSSEEEH